MFSRLRRIATLCLGILFAGTLLAIGWPKQSDLQGYITAAEQSRELTRSLPVCQDRRLVCKDIWFSNAGGERLHYRIQSVTSSLNMQPRSRKIEIIERLHDMRCWMQDKIVSSEAHTTQQSRYFTANEGVYHFLSHSLLADQATLSLYHLPGTDLPSLGCLPREDPFLIGQAEQIKMHVSGKTPLFQASNFKALLHHATE